jgi:hypothetical protein
MWGSFRLRVVEIALIISDGLGKKLPDQIEFLKSRLYDEEKGEEHNVRK